MSFSAIIEIDGIDTMKVLQCSFSFQQASDYRGKPSESPRGGKIHLVVESTGETNLLSWMLGHNIVKDGKIIFTKRDESSSMKTIEFKEAYCLQYQEFFDHETNEPMRINVVISPKVFTVKDAKFEQEWHTKANF